MLGRKFAFAMAAAVVASLMLAGGAFAKDRNHDRIPDKWEKRHHLSLAHKQGRRDQDHDGLNNRAEFKSHLDPRDADTDGDGIEDGDEHTGTVKSFDGTTLTISLFGGGEVSGAVTAETEIECDSDPADDQGQDEDDDAQGDDAQSDDDDQGEDHGAAACGTDALKPGARVLEAELADSGGAAAWDGVELQTS